MNEINDTYIRKRFGKELPQENVDSLKNAMLPYENNYWWESEDPVQIAMYQIFENILMVDFDKFHEGLEIIVGRPVFTHELGFNVEGIRKEVRLGIERLKRGIVTSDEYKETAVRKSIEMLEDYCRRTGKKFLKADLTEERPDRNESGIDRSGYDGFLS